jgi:hypothetical protein
MEAVGVAWLAILRATIAAGVLREVAYQIFVDSVAGEAVL